MEVYFEFEDIGYGKMIAELFENLSEGCLYEVLNCKHENDKKYEIIGRFVRPGEPLTKDKSALLKAAGFNIVETP